MSKKDYEKAAAIVREMAAAGASTVEVSLVATAFVRLFSGDNPRFDAQRFMQACMAVTA